MSTQLSLDSELFEANVKPSYWVNQSSDLLNAIQDLSIPERRIVYTLFALVQPDDTRFKTYVIGVKDLADLLEYKGNNLYKQVRDAVNELMKKQIIFYDYDGKQIIERRIQWVQQANYEMGSGRVTIQLSDGLTNFLLNLEKYTKYRLYNVLRLNSEYSWRMYELLKEYEWRKERVIRVAELRKMMGIPDDKLKLMKNFRANVIDHAQKELEAKTDITFTYEVHKKIGRSIDSFIFRINKNKKFSRGQVDISNLKDDIESIVHTLLRQRVSRKAAEKIANTYTYEYIDANLRYVLNVDALSVGNKAGYILAAIENNYAGYQGEAKKKSQDPMESLFLTQVLERLKQETAKDNQALTSILKLFEKRLVDNPGSRIDVIAEDRKEAVFGRLEMIENERRAKQLPPLQEEDIEHPTIKDIYREWKEFVDVLVF